MSGRSFSRFNYRDLVRPGDQKRRGDADKQPMLDHTRHGADYGREAGRVLDRAKSDVIDDIAAIGLEHRAIALAQGQRRLRIAFQ